MAARAIPPGESVSEFPIRERTKPPAYDYDAMAALDLPYRFDFPDRAAALKFRDTVFRPMKIRGIQVRLFNHFVYIRKSQENHSHEFAAASK